jgi:tetratricopeptide (TPR) repeat protein/tRNA A-37 threonylcarbamoyl transferase component Bud32
MPVADSETMVMVDVTALPPGSDFGPRYRIESLLGQGGMGRVYKAYDKDIDRTVALKVVRHGVMGETDALKRFKQELHLASKISHKNILRIHDMGEVGGTKFITMAYVEGQDLYGILKEHPKMPIERALKFATQLAEALAAAHAEGVIHRDLKPQNILVNKDDQIFVSDFGLAKSFEEGAQGMTKTGAFLGTPRYMSPEQVEGKPADQRSDLYAYGLIFYEMVTGDVPFTGESTLKVMYQRIQEKPKNPKLVNPSLPSWIARIIMRCLEKDPAERYQTAYEILADLQGSKPSGGSRSLQIQIPEFARWRWTWVAGSVVGALLLVSALLVLWGKFGSSSKRGAPGRQVTLAILPFRNESGDHTLDWLGGSLAEMLRTDVGQSAEFHTVSPDRMHQILSDLRISPDSELDASTLRRIAEFTSADRVVSGQYVKLGDQIRIDATLQDLKQQRTVSLKTEAPDERQLLGSVDQLAKAIQQNLTLAPEAVKEMQASAFVPSSKSPEALREYSQGLEFWRQGNQLEAAKRFEAATKDDPTFALAYSLLAQTYHDLGYDKQAVQYSNQSVDQSENLPPTEKYMIQAANARLQNNFDKAIEAYDNLSKLLPNDPQVQFELGALYESHGALDQAHEHYAKVVQSDPKYVEALLAVGRVETKRGNPQASLDYLNRALSSAVELNNLQGKANVLQSLGVAYRLLNKPDDALRSDEESLNIKRQIGDKRGMAASLDEIAQVHNLLGKPDQAAKDYQEVLKLEKELGDQAGMGTALMNLGDVYSNAGRFDDALSATKQGLQIQVALGDENSQALSLNNIGMQYFEKGQYNDALTYLQRALDLRQKLKVPSDIAQTMNNVGESYRMLGQYDKALDNYLYALEMSRTAGDKRQIGAISDSMATLFEQQGRYGAALSAQQDALSNFQQLQQQSSDMAIIEADYGNALTSVGRFDEAQKSLEEALKLARSLQNDSVIATVLNFQGDRFYYLGDFKSAHPLYDQALQASNRAKDSEQILVSKFNLARLSVKEGHASSAASSLKLLAKEADDKGLKYLSAQCSVSLGEALVNLKNYPQARQELESALQKSQPLGLKSLMAQGHYLLGLALGASGNKSDAAAHLQQASQLLEEMHKESRSDAILKRTDLRPIAEEASHKS